MNVLVHCMYGPDVGEVLMHCMLGAAVGECFGSLYVRCSCR